MKISTNQKIMATWSRAHISWRASCWIRQPNRAAPLRKTDGIFAILDVKRPSGLPESNWK